MNCDYCGKRIRQSDATQVVNGDMVCLECLQEHYVQCSDCNEYVLVGDTYETYDGRLICEDCHDDYYYCEDCDELYPSDDLYSVDGGNRHVCESCRDNNYTQCDDCGEWVNNDDSYHTYDDRYICESCREHYYCCENCGDYVHEDEVRYNQSNGYDYCPDCYDDCRGCIYDYHEFDDFYTLRMPSDDNNARTFGCELEVSGNQKYAD